MQCSPMQCSHMQCSHMQCSPCSAAQCSATHAFVVLFHSSNYALAAYLFHVISISHSILANFWLMHVDLLIFKYNHTQFSFLAGILTNYYMMKHAARVTCRLNLWNTLVYTLLLYVLETQKLYCIALKSILNQSFWSSYWCVIIEDICENGITSKIELNSPALELFE